MTGAATFVVYIIGCAAIGWCGSDRIALSIAAWAAFTLLYLIAAQVSH